MPTVASPTTNFTIEPQGRFSLRESALFGFGQRLRPVGVGNREPDFDGVMRLAFCVDRPGGAEVQTGVELRQDDDGVHAIVHSEGDVDVYGGVDIAAVRAQVARVLSLDHDGRGYDEVGERDPVIAKLQALTPGLRPPLFYSPYEAAAWAVLSARRPGWQMDEVRTALSRAHGAVFELAGTQLAAFPTPRQLLDVGQFERIDPQRLERLHGIAQAALDGVLDVDTLRSLPPDDAMQHVKRIKGIGPFYAALIVIRSLGHADILPLEEPHVRDVAGRLYELGGPASPEQLQQLAEPWKPWRTWCSVLLRAASSRLG